MSKNKITVDAGYWFQTVIGLLKVFGVLFVTAIACLYYPAIATPVFFVILYIFVSNMYLFITERTYKKLETGFSKSQNEELLKTVFEQLHWENSKSMNRIEVNGSDDYFSIFESISFSIIYADDCILYNVIYKYDGFKGRVPFSIFRLYIIWRFKRTIRRLSVSNSLISRT
jgi:hypothetical protein